MTTFPALPTATAAAALLTPERRRHVPSALSASSLNDYLQCQEGWAFGRIERMPSEPGVAATAGSHAHLVLERVMALSPAERTPRQAATVDAHLRSYITHQLDRLHGLNEVERVAALAERDSTVSYLDELWHLRGELDSIFELADAAIAGYFQMASPERVTVIANEMSLSQVWETSYGPTPVRAFIDRVDQLADGAFQVLDYKTGKAPSGKYQPTGLSDYERQVLLYAAMVQEELGKLPVRGLLLYVTHKLPVVVEVTQERVDAIRELAGSVWADMQARFPVAYTTSPSPLCGWCIAVDRCPSGAAEVLRRAERGTGKGGLRADAPARDRLPLPLVA